MEEIYYPNACTYSPGGGGDHRSQDDISLLLNQILHSSSIYSSVSSHTTPYSSSTVAPLESYHDSSKCAALVKEGIFCLDSGNGVNVGDFSGSGARNTPSFSIGGVSENETDEYDCESEELPAKPTATRSSSKRSRAAEVHNLSEKRRRSRINEKMKALQNLIPNSNKTDKASMLDEAIEYLKHLQLQFQMLSMRNGISLQPMLLPRMLQPIQHSHFGTGSCKESQMSIIESAEQTLNHLSNQLSLHSMPTTLNSETPMGIDSSVHAHFNPFPLLGGIGREGSLIHQHLNIARIPPEVEAAKATALPQASTFKGCILSKNIDCGAILPTNLQGS